MRRDRRLLDRFERDPNAEAVLRLFRFDPPGITLGHSQAPERELDLERCRCDGVPWAVRPTGGRAIFHAEEWTYSLSAALDDPEWGGGLAEAYARAGRVVQASLARLGVAALLAPGTRAARAESPDAAVTPGRAGGAAPPCFASTARHEIVLEGRKLVGSAQRRTSHGLLQQGSVLLGTGHLRLVDYLRLPGDTRERLRAGLERQSAHAAGLAGRALEEWADALMAVLPDGTRRHDAASGGFLLTPEEAGPYTPRSS